MYVLNDHSLKIPFPHLIVFWYVITYYHTREDYIFETVKIQLHDTPCWVLIVATSLDMHLPNAPHHYLSFTVK